MVLVWFNELMIKLFLVATLILGIWYWRNILHRTTPEKRKEFIWNSAIWALLIVSIGLVVTGKIHWIGAGLAALIPLLKWIIVWGWRALPLLRMFGFTKQIPSQFRTKSLFVTINFASQDIDGEILTGTFEGKRLSELTLEELRLLADEWRENDKESFILLQSYILRTRDNSGFEGSSYSATKPDISELTQTEALEILGLDPDATKSQVQKAHKRLIQRLHPDRGGSDYLAAKINAAKDKLTSR